jgi:hypothetical protein
VPIYEITKTGINRLSEATYSSAGIQERRDLQRLLREHIDVIAPNALIIAEEFGDWADSKRRIDLLAIGKDANLVVIELKRTEDGGHMELQAIRYAAMVSTMTFEKAVETFGEYLDKIGKGGQDPRSIMLEFLEWDAPNDTDFAQEVRIVLASANFSPELTSSVLWLRTYNIDVCCMRLKPYSLDGRLLIDVQQIIPLPEATDYQVKFREKVRQERESRTSIVDFTRWDIQIEGEAHESQWKRNAIFLICKYLCEHGIKPDEITQLFDWRKNRVWLSVEGQLSASEFAVRASEIGSSGGPSYDPRRWFHGDDELVRVDGKTYAFSNQWGGPMWLKAMTLLKEKYPQFHIAFSAAS